MLQVTLEPYEIEVAEFTGRRREEALHKDDRWKQPHCEETNGRSSLENNVLGAAAEIVVAKVLNLYAHLGVNTFKTVPDVGIRTEVRYRSMDRWGILVRDEDPEDRVYVLVQGAMPNFEVVGSILGRKAKQRKYRANPHGKGWCYIAPDEELDSVSHVIVPRLVPPSEDEAL